MGYGSDVTELRRQAAYEALSPAEKAAYQSIRGAKAVSKGIHKVATLFGAKKTRAELRDEIENLKNKSEENQERRELENIRNNLKVGYKQQLIEEKMKRKEQRSLLNDNAKYEPSEHPELYIPNTPIIKIEKPITNLKESKDEKMAEEEINDKEVAAEPNATEPELYIAPTQEQKAEKPNAEPVKEPTREVPNFKNPSERLKYFQSREKELDLENRQREKDAQIKAQEQKNAREAAELEVRKREAAIIAPVKESSKAIKAQQAAYLQQIQNQELSALQTQENLINQKKRVEESKRALSASKTNQAVNTVKQVVAGLGEIGSPGVLAPAGENPSSLLETQIVPAYAPNPIPQQPQNFYTDTADRFKGVGGAVNSRSTDIVNSIGGGVPGQGDPNALLELAGGKSQTQLAAEAQGQSSQDLLSEIGGQTPFNRTPEPVYYQIPPQPQPEQIIAPAPIQQAPVPAPTLNREPTVAVPVPQPRAPVRLKPQRIVVTKPIIIRPAPKIQKIYVPKPVVTAPGGVIEKKEKRTTHDHAGRPRKRGRPSIRAIRERLRRERQKQQG